VSETVSFKKKDGSKEEAKNMWKVKWGVRPYCSCNALVYNGMPCVHVVTAALANHVKISMPCFNKRFLREPSEHAPGHEDQLPLSEREENNPSLPESEENDPSLSESEENGPSLPEREENDHPLSQSEDVDPQPPECPEMDSIPQVPAQDSSQMATHGENDITSNDDVSSTNDEDDDIVPCDDILDADTQHITDSWLNTRFSDEESCKIRGLVQILEIDFVTLRESGQPMENVVNYVETIHRNIQKKIRKLHEERSPNLNGVIPHPTKKVGKKTYAVVPRRVKQQYKIARRQLMQKKSKLHNARSQSVTSQLHQTVRTTTTRKAGKKEKKRDQKKGVRHKIKVIDCDSCLKNI